MTTHEKQVAKFMKNLGLTKEEAEQLIADDEKGVSAELTKEQKQVAKQMAQGDRKKETAPRKRERKADDDRRELIRVLCECLGGAGSSQITISNIEREIDFVFKNEKFRLTLAKPRKEK